MFLVLPIYLDVSHLKDEGFLVDELLDLEVVLPIGLTAHDASVEWKGILESGRRENDDNLTAESTSSKTNNKRAHVDRGFPYYNKPRFDAMVNAAVEKIVSRHSGMHYEGTSTRKKAPTIDWLSG